MTPLQRRMMKELLTHLDELNIHIKNLDDEINDFMKPEEKQAAKDIQDITGIETPVLRQSSLSSVQTWNDFY